eukprot:g7205.t1
MHIYPKRASLEGLEIEIFKLVSYSATPEQWKEWLRVPLEHAAARGNLDLFNKLLGAGADGSAGWRGCRDRTMLDAAAVALDIAANEGHGDVVEAIVAYGTAVADADTSDNGFTALRCASRNDHAGAVNALIKAGTDVELKSTDGITPLGYAAYMSSHNAMLALLQHGAKLDVRDIDGNTPLHAACWGRRQGVEAAVDLLLRRGADETALTEDGHSPADMLDVDMNDDVDNPSTQNEIERTRLLLVRAPADRAWRRRGWLAVLRSRSKETRTTSPDGDSENEGGSSNWGRDTEGGRRKVARTHGSGGAERSVHGKVGAGSGTEGKGEGWSGVVELLLGMEVDGVFRTVVGFL